ncbi:hypothetical protein TREVI0001_0405 [Treponema vincentii ATCC 35580]|uniref:Uncharacterized protein n=1 Tax=Treponema vincentii ATCC 35580 TaxID=596324 RepID=C8PSY2_9SPIR|nr:hypothetical protein TREVI0001_0405 [Treponema vincentii ATCC 35580]
MKKIMVCMCLLAFTGAVYTENWKYRIPGHFKYFLDRGRTTDYSLYKSAKK